MPCGVKELQPVHDSASVSPSCDLYIEARLAQRGVLRLLEALHVIPVVVNPNPYAVETQLRAHDVWWRQHPAEAASYCAALEERRKALLCVSAAFK